MNKEKELLLELLIEKYYADYCEVFDPSYMKMFDCEGKDYE